MELKFFSFPDTISELATTDLHTQLINDETGRKAETSNKHFVKKKADINDCILKRKHHDRVDSVIACIPRFADKSHVQVNAKMFVGFIYCK